MRKKRLEKSFSPSILLFYLFIFFFKEGNEVSVGGSFSSADGRLCKGISSLFSMFL
jgi:hypothetical protein